MPRRRSRNKVTVSLFPFLSILACVIGTLTLMIAALALGQMDTDAMAGVEEYEQVKAKLEADRKAVEQLQRDFAQRNTSVDDADKQLVQAEVALTQLRRQKQEAAAALEKPPEVKPNLPAVDAAAHQRLLKELETELREQEERKKKLLAELQQRKKPPAEAEVVVRPGGSGVDLDPTFVECTAGGVVIHEGKTPPFVRRADLASDPKFVELLQRVAKQPKATVIFLIRDDGLGTYYAARDQARARYARNGKLPVIGHGKLDLSLFHP